MPGIFGIITKLHQDESPSTLASMVGSMMYEKFYQSETFIDHTLGVAIGWVDHKHATSPRQPIWNEDKTVCLIFTGETFEDPSVVEALRHRGHRFNPSGEGYLIHLYEENGLKFLERINGPLSGVLIDIRRQEATLFNDRYGLNRIYFHHNEHVVYFSSEAKAILKVLPSTREFDAKSLGEFLSCGSVLQNRTLFSKISLLPPGSAWTFGSNGQSKKQTYFKREPWESQSSLDPEEYYERLRAIWGKVIPRYFSGDDQVALSLTGGVDSRMILAWTPEGPGSLPCYTWGGKFRDCADVKVARKLASVCGQPHRTIPLDREFLANYPSLAARAVFISDGAMDVTGSVDLYVQTIARKIAPVRLSGVYGGEILRRLVIFKPSALRLNWLDNGLRSSVAEAAETYAEELQGDRLSFIAFKQAPWVMTGKFAIERSQLTFRTPYFDNELVGLAYRAPTQSIETNSPSLRLIADGNPALAAFETDRGLRSGTIPGITQARHALQQFTFKAEYAYDYGMPQWLARIDGSLAPLHLEKLFLGRHKFHHFRVWYRDELSRYLEETLLDARSLGRSHLDPSATEALVRDHLAGSRNHTLEIHKILTLELIHQTLFEQN